MTAATYLYCVLRSAEKPSLVDVPQGLPDAAPPDLLPVSRGLWLVAASVPLDVYGPGHLETLLGDFDRVSRVAVAHETVVEHFARLPEVTVVPMKLFTMFSTPHRATAGIESRKKSLTAAMKHIEGAEEWGVRVTAARGTSAAGREAARPKLSGSAFLAGKKKARDEVREAKVAAAEAAITAFERLTAISRDARRRSEPPAGGVSPPLLDAAFLVSLKDRDRFKATVQREADACARAGARMTLTGPWPAYNFIQSDEAK